MQLANELGWSECTCGTNWNEHKALKRSETSSTVQIASPPHFTPSLPPFPSTRAAAMGGCNWAWRPAFAGTKDSWCWGNGWVICVSLAINAAWPGLDHRVHRGKEVRGLQGPGPGPDPDPDPGPRPKLQATRPLIALTGCLSPWGDSLLNDAVFVFSRNNAGERERFQSIYFLALSSKMGEL